MGEAIILFEKTSSCGEMICGMAITAISPEALLQILSADLAEAEVTQAAEAAKSEVTQAAEATESEVSQAAEFAEAEV